MKIKITNTEKLDRELDRVQSRSTARKFWATEIEGRIFDIGANFSSSGISKKNQLGIIAYITTSESVASAYKYPVSYTTVRVEKCSSGWFVTLILRDLSSGYIADTFLLSADQTEMMRKKMLENIAVRAEK